MARNRVVWGLIVIIVGIAGAGTAWYLWHAHLMPGLLVNSDISLNISKWQTSSSSTTVSTGEGMLACQNILVITRSDHPLMQRAAESFCDTLKLLPWDVKVECVNPGDKPIEPSSRPDICVMLDMGPLKQQRSPGKIALDGNVYVSAGQSPWASHSQYFDGSEGSMVRLQWTAELSHSSESTGASPANGEYDQVGQRIGKELATSLTKQLCELESKNGLMAPLPRDFLGNGNADEPASLSKTSAKLAFATPGWFINRESFWLLTDNSEPAKFLARMQGLFEADGYKGTPSIEMINLRMTSGQKVIEVFEIVQERPTLAATAPTGTPRQYCIHYLHRMSRDQIQGLLDTAISGTGALDVATAFWPMLSSTQKLRVLPELQKSPGTPQTLLRLAQLYHGEHNDAEAKAALTRAAILSLTLENSQIETQLKDMAKELGDEKISRPVLTEETIVAAGFRKLQAIGSSSATRPAASMAAPLVIQVQQEPLRFYYKDEKRDEWVLFVLGVRRASQPTPGSPFELFHLEYHTGQQSKSWGTVGVNSNGETWTAASGNGKFSFSASGGRTGPFTLTVQDNG